MKRRVVAVALLALAGACKRSAPPAPSTAPSESASVVAGGRGAGMTAAPDLDEDPPASPAPKKSRKLPTGAPSRLSCTAMRTLVDDVLARMAAPPPPITAAQEAEVTKELADGTIDWADPYGLWTAAPDSTVAAALHAHAAELRAVVEGKADCATTMRPFGEAMVAWADALRKAYDGAVADAAKDGAIDLAAFKSAVATAELEDGVPTRPAMDLARRLGDRIGIAAAYAPMAASLRPEIEAARARWMPGLDADAWGEVLLAAAVRAYVPIVDPHGAWAPGDEASTLFDRDLELSPPPRLWGASTRTALGMRVDGDPAAPLKEGDVVLSIDGVSLTGLSMEAIDQLSEAPDGEETMVRTVRVLRAGAVVSLEVRATFDDAATIEASTLPADTISYGDGRVLVVKLPDDVPDALGDDLARTIAAARDHEDLGKGGALVGVVLDLRGNGGGSIEGATGALGVFLPGAPLFPLKHRDGAIETERAAEPAAEDRWAGPVAAIVDAGTASAAEMIAGALHAYRRGLVVGTATYGKGCAQEYVDDATGVGVLRLTTLLFALPDGSAVQRIGLHPDLALPLPAPVGLKEHEVDLLHAPPSWSGPDVRDPKRVVEVAWPNPEAGKIGPCADGVVCKALKGLGGTKIEAKR